MLTDRTARLHGFYRLNEVHFAPADNDALCVRLNVGNYVIGVWPEHASARCVRGHQLRAVQWRMAQATRLGLSADDMPNYWND